MTIIIILLFLAKTFLIRFAPWKKKYMTGNYWPFANKALSKAIMVRTKLRNTFLKNRSEENYEIKKTKKLCNEIIVSLLRKSERLLK